MISKPPLKKIAASVRARLTRRASERRENVQLALTRYAIERLPLLDMPAPRLRARHPIAAAMMRAAMARPCRTRHRKRTGSRGAGATLSRKCRAGRKTKADYHLKLHKCVSNGYTPANEGCGATYKGSARSAGSFYRGMPGAGQTCCSGAARVHARLHC